MPGLSALQQFNADMLNLGDEVKIRSARGEKPVTVPIPQDIPDVDDSEDFRLGLPVLSEEEQEQADAAAREREREANDFSDITGSDEDEEETVAETPVSTPVPDVSDLLSTDALSLDELDLSDFEEPEEEKEPEPPKEIPIEDLDLDALLAPREEPKPQPQQQRLPPLSERARANRPKPSKTETVDTSVFDAADSQNRPQPKVPAKKTVAEPQEELDELESLEPLDEEAAPSFDNDTFSIDIDADSNSGGEDFTQNIQLPDTDELLKGLGSPEAASVPETDTASSADTAPADTEPFAEEFSMPDIDESIFADSGAAAEEAPVSEGPAASEETSVPEEPAAAAEEPAVSEEVSAIGDIPVTDETPLENTESPLDTEDDISLPDDEFGDFSGSIDMTEDLPNEFIEVPDEPVIKRQPVEPVNEETEAESKDEPNVQESLLSDLEFDSPLPDLDSLGTDSGDGFDSGDTFNEPDTSAVTDGFDMPDSFDSPDVTDTTAPETSSDADTADSEEPADSGDTDSSQEEKLPSFGDDPFSTEGLDDFAGFDSGEDISLPDFGDEPKAPDAMESVPEETFDTSAIDDLNFEGQEDTGDFEMGDITSTEGDDDAFFIPGFSDTTSADLDKKPKVETPDFSQALQGENGKEKPKNTFTDAEYKRFLKNLNEYPLNVRIAVEDLVVKNELTDDAVFSILDKVLRKVPARSLASELSKLLDISLDVPYDFERRSATEYELYKKSIEYQLKNKIIPGAILTAFAAIVIFCIYVLSKTFIYEPLMARHLYNQGYVLLENEQYPQSLDSFNLAVNHKIVKKWFFKYAQGYRQHRQYDRSRSMYKRTLNQFNHDMQAGLEWADMEGFELYNYEEAERILKREVLDYHINDSRAMLMLGDLYLDWGSELSPEKLSLAKQQYDLLIQYYGSTNEYLAREMRYFIRTDNLRQVLMYKDIFYPNKKSLGAQDLTELSGFLLDKRYGKLRTSEESLRFNIENVRELLERAVKADNTNPEALYNMGRYFVETSNGKSAVRYLDSATDRFDRLNYRTKKQTYKFINSYRLLGEEYRNEREYLLAEESYGKGIDLFEKENAHSGFESDENVGRLYADIADLDYFISADNDRALKNYINAVNNKYDNSSVRYRIGYIQYHKENYSQALGSFILSHETNPNDANLILALANTLSLKNDNYVAKGYYENLIENLNSEREILKAKYSNASEKQAEVTDLYMRSTNNLGVTLSRIADQTGDSSLNAKAIVNLQESLRAWDSLTRNPTTMIRLEGSNLAEQNIKYITNPYAEYSPEIYTEISRVLSGEEILK